MGQMMHSQGVNSTIQLHPGRIRLEDVQFWHGLDHIYIVRSMSCFKTGSHAFDSIPGSPISTTWLLASSYFMIMLRFGSFIAVGRENGVKEFL